MTAFFGRVGDDELGHMFIDETLRTGTVMNPRISLDTEGRPTSRSIVLVTPDGERTMLTALGASGHLTPENIDGEILSAVESRVFFEAYVLDTPAGRDTAERILIEKSARTFVTLSDPLCVHRNVAQLRRLFNFCTNIAFGNEKEWSAYALATGAVHAVSERTRFHDAVRG